MAMSGAKRPADQFSGALVQMKRPRQDIVAAVGDVKRQQIVAGVRVYICVQGHNGEPMITCASMSMFFIFLKWEPNGEQHDEGCALFKIIQASGIGCTTDVLSQLCSTLSP